MFVLSIIALGVLTLCAIWVAVYLVSSNANGLVNAYSVGCPKEAIPEILPWLAVPDGGTLLEVGCGDGRIMRAFLIANPGAYARGVENNTAMLLVAHINLLSFGRRSSVHFGDGLRWHDDADSVFTYLSPRMMKWLEGTMNENFPRMKRLVSLQFPLPGRDAHHVVRLRRHRPYADVLYVYDF